MATNYRIQGVNGKVYAVRAIMTCKADVDGTMLPDSRSNAQENGLKKWKCKFQKKANCMNYSQLTVSGV